MPEARIPLAHATVYLATAPKSTAPTPALDAAMKEVKEGVTLAVPRHLRSTRQQDARRRRSGTRAINTATTARARTFRRPICPKGRRYYEPRRTGYEKRVKERLDYWRALFEQSQGK